MQHGIILTTGHPREAADLAAAAEAADRVVHDLLDAAHIQEDSGGGRPVVTNGLTL